MAIAASSLVNTSNDNSNKAAPSITHTVTLTAGQGLVLFAVHNLSGFTSATLSCTTKPGGAATPTMTRAGGVDDVAPPGGAQGYEVFWITGVDTSGSYTFTYSIVDANDTWADMSSVKVDGHVNSAAAIVAFGGQAQHNPASGDTVTSTPATPTAYPCLLVALSCDAQCGLTPSSRSGSSQTDHGSGFGFFGYGAGGRIVSKRLTSGDAEALFSVSGGTSDTTTIMVVIQEASTAQTISPSGVGSGEAHGSATVANAAGGQSVSPSGVATSGAFGSLVAAATFALALTGIASAGAFGSTVVSGGATTITPSGVASAGTFGEQAVFDKRRQLATSGHHLVDGNGDPKFLLLEAGWCASVMLTREEFSDYLDTIKSQGFDGIIWEMMESGDYGGTANAYGDEPFTTPYDLTTPNPAYWAHVDWMLRALYERNMYSLGNALYNGYNNGTDGWAPYTSPSEATAHGTFIGGRYKDYPHHVHGNYGDWLPSPPTNPTNYRNAVVAAGATQLWTNHLSRNSGAGSTGTDAGDSPTLNTSYMGDTVVFQRVAGDWALSPTLATGLYEGQYEGSFATSPTLNAQEVRRQLWHAACGGATYVCGGHHTVWQFLAGWDTVIDNWYGSTMAPLPALWRSVRWYDLEPQASGVLVTSGEGTGAAYVSACKASDGKLAIFYAPHGSSSSFTVALGSLASSVRTRWYDVVSGAWQTAGAGTYTGAGNTSFTKPGNNSAGSGNADWALVVEELPTVAPGGIASAGAFGAAALSLAVATTGIASAGAFGTAALGQAVACTGVATTEAFGSCSVAPGAAPLAPSGVATAEVFGSHVVSSGAAGIATSGIGSAEAFGAHTLTSGATPLQPTSAASSEAFGACSLAPGAAPLLASPVVTAEAFGSSALIPGAAPLAPSAIGSLETFGTAAVTKPGAIAAQGVGSAEGFGALALLPGGVSLPAQGVATGEGFGAALLGLYASPAGVGSAEALGAPTLGAVGGVSPVGVPGTEAFGSALLGLFVGASGVVSSEAHGAPALAISGQTLFVADGIGSLEALGVGALSPGTAFVLTQGVASGEAFGLILMSGGNVFVPLPTVASPGVVGRVPAGFRRSYAKVPR